MPVKPGRPGSPPFFAYGTLSDRQMLMRILARAIDPDALLTAAAPGWRAAALPDAPWTVLARAPGRAAPGLVVLGLSPFERDLLDAWEGEAYARAALPVMIAAELHMAEAYLPVTPPPPDAPDWRLADWQLNHKGAAIVEAGREADQLRRDLIAIRPN